jgi:hypothetical protein
MCSNNFLGDFYDRPKNSVNPNMDKIINCIPIFNLFLKEISFGDIIGVESINVERFNHRTFIYEMVGSFGNGQTATSREINSKLIINVSCVSNCLVEIKDSSRL